MPRERVRCFSPYKMWYSCAAVTFLPPIWEIKTPGDEASGGVTEEESLVSRRRERRTQYLKTVIPNEVP